MSPQAIRDATEKVKGSVSPFSVGGSLPLVGDMQAAGFDLQICGYGLSSVYHGVNEYCNLSDMQAAMKIFSEVGAVCFAVPAGHGCLAPTKRTIPLAT